MTKLINKHTGLVIEEDSIVSKSDNGVVSKNKNCWKYTPKKYLGEEKEFAEIKREDIPSKKNVEKVGDFFVEENIREDFVDKRRAYSIITNISFEQRAYEKSSAFISKPIDVSNCSYIELKTNCNADSSDFLEVSIIDGIDEYPVLPIDDSPQKDIKEKLFFMIDTRFPIDYSYGFSVYRETEDIGQIDVSSITQEKFEANNYYIRYTPANIDYYRKYTPKNKNVKIKAVLRTENISEEKSGIQPITLFRFGGAPQWT